MVSSGEERESALIASFLDIVGAQADQDTASNYLLAANWSVEEAVQLFYDVASTNYNSFTPSGWEEADAPLPVRRETLYGDNGFSNAVMESTHPSSSSCQSNQRGSGQHPSSSSSTTSEYSSLQKLYRPPTEMLYKGRFDAAKAEGVSQDKWLLVNVQSEQEFSSHLLNRDTWSNEVLKQAITSNFIFWQVQSDCTDGAKVSTYYKLDSFPAILVIDPVTGQKMKSWCGMVQPEDLLDSLCAFMEGGPNAHYALPRRQPEGDVSESVDITLKEEVASLMEDTDSIEKLRSYPPLTEEPKAGSGLVCRVGIRLSDGRRVQRNFLRLDTVRFLWSFCAILLEEGETRTFHFRQVITGGASKKLEYESDQNFEEAGLANSLISLTWDD